MSLSRTALLALSCAFLVAVCADVANMQSNVQIHGSRTVSAKRNRYRYYGARSLRATAEDRVKGEKEGKIAGPGVMTKATMADGHHDISVLAGARPVGIATGDKGAAGLGPAHAVAQAKRNGRQAKKDKLKTERHVKKGLKKGVHKVEKMGKHAGRKFKRVGRKWKHGKKKMLKKQGIPLLAGAGAGAAAAAAAAAAAGSGGGTGIRKLFRGNTGFEEGFKASSITTEGNWGDEGLLHRPGQAKPHMTIAGAFARLAEDKLNNLADVSPFPLTDDAPPRRQTKKFKVVVPAFYHGKEFHPPTEPIPLVMGEHHFIHPEMAASLNLVPTN
ncbi:hypothetical protein VYU27_002386 [Nannochloropsis oceanica]